MGNIGLYQGKMNLIPLPPQNKLIREKNTAYLRTTLLNEKYKPVGNLGEKERCDLRCF